MRKKNLEYVILYHMGKMQLMDVSKDLITFQLGISTDIVPGLLELLLEQVNSKVDHNIKECWRKELLKLA